MRREMSPRSINSLMKEPAGRQSQFEGAEKWIGVNWGRGGGEQGKYCKLRLKTG